MKFIYGLMCGFFLWVFVGIFVNEFETRKRQKRFRDYYMKKRNESGQN